VASGPLRSGILPILIAVAMSCPGCSAQPKAVPDPIEGFPVDQQQTIVRAAVEKSWPLTVGRGTLGCQSGAVVFRFNGVSCTLIVSARHRITQAELRLIRDEGNERSWPPLERGKADLKPLVDRGLKLCKP